MKNKFKILIAALFSVGLWEGVAAQSGTLDLTFNSTGKVFSTTADNNNDVKIQSDGKIVTVGSTNNGTNIRMKVVRLLSTGALDPGFGTGGVFTYLSGNEAAAYDCHILPSGKILVVGYRYDFTANGADITVLQLNANGTLDAGFGTGGVATLNPGMNDIAYGVTVLGNGSILVAGESSAIVGTEEVEYATIVKLNSNGTVDASFGTSGYAKVTGYDAVNHSGVSGNKFNDIKVQSDGKILGIGSIGSTLAWATNYSCLIARFSATGVLDASYGTSGKVVKNINGLYDAFYDGELTSANELIVTGSTQISAVHTTADLMMVLLKYTINGQPATFGTSGMVTVPPTNNTNGNGSGGLTVALQSDGKILVGGNTDGTVLANQNYAVWRLTSAGALDNTFGTSGLAKFDFGPSGRDEATGLALQTDGKIVSVGGSMTGTPVHITATTIRLNNTVVVTGLTLNLTALIEGFYTASTNTMISDVISVELHNSTSPYALVTSKTGVTLSSAGIATVNFTGGVSGVNYYIVVKHRNSIETWSATAVPFVSGSLSYDFTNLATKAFGSNMIKKGTKWCIYSGDVTQDGTVDLNDMTPIDNDAFNFAGGYIVTDVNGDQAVDLNDMTIVDNNSFNFISLVRP